ncbi:hypothetical protein BCR39DRAFT_80831 [Naematelia encephala]|uniref:Cation efflux protein transmembrane domain-containing protein n=1 Tax=Naematelia encephala TaxID=71784 RepID=A0A1Y2BB80_9TREE|nr:hypothetical protein BCR39DRAFT_80831 [Naematelia encephala]
MSSYPTRSKPPFNRGLTTPPPTSHDHDHAHDYFSTSPVITAKSPSFHRQGSMFMRHQRRGMTVEDLASMKVISDENRSKLFEGIPIGEKEIKSLPRKLRPYYENLALLHEHYAEVDGLLSGELPSAIAKSFQPAHSAFKVGRKSYTRMICDLEEEVADSPALALSRHESAWRINGRGGEDDEAEVGEGTGLLDGQKRDQRRERIAKLALNINTVVNVLLVAAKAVAVLYSSSISLTASLVDSALDLLSTLIILGTSWAIGVKGDRHRYPAGKRRFEPLGVLIFSVAMIASFVQVFIESFERARAPADEAPVELSKIGIATMLATIIIKLILWQWCSRIPSSGVQALAQDAENDVWFNIMSLAFPFVGTKLSWRLLDPIGGMVLSTYIIVEWVKTLLENFANLSGKAATRDQITRVLYLVSRFTPVQEIGDVECYHIGDDLIVEIDVILPKSSTLHFAHDIGETIQCVLERCVL